MQPVHSGGNLYRNTDENLQVENDLLTEKNYLSSLKIKIHAPYAVGNGRNRNFIKSNTRFKKTQVLVCVFN